VANNNYLLGDAKRVITSALAGASRQTLTEDALLKEHLRVELKRFIQKRTGAKPVITFVIVKA
jgi:mRNA degradation ribonuclease J1/J2